MKMRGAWWNGGSITYITRPSTQTTHKTSKHVVWGGGGGNPYAVQRINIWLKNDGTQHPNRSSWRRAGLGRKGALLTWITRPCTQTPQYRKQPTKHKNVWYSEQGGWTHRLSGVLNTSYCKLKWKAKLFGVLFYWNINLSSCGVRKEKHFPYFISAQY